MTADVVTIQLHHASDRLEIGAVVALRRRNDHGVVLPARPAEVRGRRNLQHVAVPLMVVEDARVGDAGGPRGEHVAAIAAGNDEVAFRHRERDVPRPRSSRMVRILASVSCHAAINCSQVASGSRRYRSPRSTGCLRRIGIEHVMEREVLHVFSGHLRHARRPAAVAPRDQLNRGIGRTHGLRKLDGLARRGFEIEAVPVVGRLVPDLPVPDVQRRRVAVRLPFAIVRVVAVRHPFGGFPRVGRADAVLDLHVLPVARPIRS